MVGDLFHIRAIEYEITGEHWHGDCSLDQDLRNLMLAI